MSERRRGVSLRQIEAFARIFEAKSVSGGAKALGLTQPTASAHLKSLEEELGVELFRRQGRGLDPTSAGERLYAHAGRLLALKDEAVAAIARLGPGLKGDLDIGASNIPGTYLLPAVVAPFHEAHPDVRVSVQVADSAEILQRVARGVVALGFVGKTPDAEKFVVRPFGSDTVILIAAAFHPLAGKTVEVRALTSERFVVREKGSGTREAAEKGLAEHDLRFGDSLPVVLEVGSNEAAREAARAGVGLTFLSQLSVRLDLEHGTLAQVKVRGLSIPRRFFAVNARGRAIPPVAQAFLEAVQPERQK